MKQKLSTMKKIYLLLIFSAFVIFLLVAFWLKKISQQIFITPQVPQVKYVNLIDEYLNKKLSFNILLLGYGGASHDGTFLTDSMIIMHLDPRLESITLISLPRDLWVKIPGNASDAGYKKINHAFQIGLNTKSLKNLASADFNQKILQAGNLTKTTVELVSGLQISKFVAVNFAGFKKSIDVLGGIDVQIEKTFDDYEYPVEGREKDLCGREESELPELIKIATSSPLLAFPCRYERVHFDAGLVHLDGENALKYVRSRHSLQDGTDFGRSKRQRNLLVAVKDKIINIGFIPKIIPFISSLQDDVKTDLTLSETRTLITYSDQLNRYKIKNIALTNENVLKDAYSEDRQYILIPKEGIDKWSLIYQWIKSELSVKKASSSAELPPAP